MNHLTTVKKSFQGGFLNTYNYRTIVCLIFIFLSNLLYADSQLDIRSNGILIDTDEIPYVLSVNDCSDLISISYHSGSSLQRLSVSDTARQVYPVNSCTADIVFSGEKRFEPSVSLTYKTHSGNQVLTYSEKFTDKSEQFVIDRQEPELSFNHLSFSQIGDHQYLNVYVTAQDNIDISYVGFSITGLRASSLRSAGGVIDKAREEAFVSTDEFQKVYPLSDTQKNYTLSAKMTTELDADAIAHDGVVFCDIYAQDAFGNRTSISEIRFTGEDVVEEAYDISAKPDNIIFTNILESITIIPSVTFQFRGLTPLPGSGTGVKYESSRPDLVAVTGAGVVYPLTSTSINDVFIKVSYPKLSEVSVPVEINTEKELKELNLNNLNDNGEFVLSRLNSFYSIPMVNAVFTDDTQSSVSSLLQLKFEIEIPNDANKLIYDEEYGLKALSTITSSDQIFLNISIDQFPDIYTRVPIIAIDAPPEIKLTIPSKAQAGSDIEIIVNALDDVRIKSISVMMEDQKIADAQNQTTFTTFFKVPVDDINQTIHFKAIAIDSSGKQSGTPEYGLLVVEKISDTIPDIEIEEPSFMKRYVEATPVSFKISTAVPNMTTRSGISYVEFFLDGKKIGNSYFPFNESRESPPGILGNTTTSYHEVWRFHDMLDSISDTETSVAFHAMIHMNNGAYGKSDSSIFRVIQNSSPTVKLISPVPGSHFVSGQLVSVNIEVSDDTLPLGVDTIFGVNDKSYKKIRFSNSQDMYSGNLDIKTISHTIQIPVDRDTYGDAIRFQLESSDFHGLIARSETFKFLILNDEPPGIAITNPSEGARIISGLPVEIRANAVDDVLVDRVDFYVDKRLVGSDQNAPYSFQYKTMEGNPSDQLITIYGIAIDNMGNTKRSDDIVATIGKDTYAPVINLVSPEVFETKGGMDWAKVIEDTTVVFKFAGYDNVSVNRLTVTGISQQFQLTGYENHRLDENTFMIQQIPGTMNAFSALKLVKIHPFDQTRDISFNTYFVSATAADVSGNESTLKLAIQVLEDQPPKVVNCCSNRKKYYATEIAMQAIDDCAVNSISIDYYVNASNTITYSTSEAITPTSNNIQFNHELPLSLLNIENDNYTITARISATDNKKKQSKEPDSYTYTFYVQKDTTAPFVSINQPVQGSTLYRNQTVTFYWRAVDFSKLYSVIFLSDGKEIEKIFTPDSLKYDSHFNYTVPAEGNEFSITIIATDIFQNNKAYDFSYQLIEEESPKIIIRSPAPCTQLYEGELFTLNALVTNDTRVQSVDLVMKTENEILFKKRMSLNEADEYLYTSLRMPHRREADAPEIFFEIIATDEKVYTSTYSIFFDDQKRCFDPTYQTNESNHYPLVILDDEISPKIAIIQPESQFTVTPGQFFSFEASGDDNYYIETITPLIADSSGNYSTIETQSISRQDREKTITMPNPNSFGSVVLDKLFLMDCQGRVQLPYTFFNHVGETFNFLMKVNDLGYNYTQSDPVQFTIMGDTNAPIIKIIQPGTSVNEHQKVSAHVQISDDILITSYHIYIDGNPIQTLEQKNLVSTDIDWSTYHPTEKTENTFIETELTIDLSAYSATNPYSNQLVIIAEATDISNTAREVIIVNITEDNPPIVSVLNEIPQDKLVKGDLSFQTIHIEDDFVSQDSPLSCFPIYTSLSDSRQFTGLTQNGCPIIAVSYPESQELTACLSIAGNPYIKADNKVLTIFPINTYNSSQYLKLDFGKSYNVQYHIKGIQNNPCHVETINKTIESPKGITLSELTDINYMTITPKVFSLEGKEIQTFIHGIQIDSSNLEKIRQSLNVQNKEISTLNDPIIFTVFLEDSSAGNLTAFVASHSMVSQTDTTTHNFSTFIPVPVHYDIDQLNIIAHGIDGFSENRDAIPLSIMSSRSIIDDQEPPSISVLAPSNGSSVIPLQRFDIKLNITDNSNHFSSLKIYENQKLIRELSGIYGEKEYTIPYDVPEAFSGGELHLLFVAKDYSQLKTFSEITLPILDNAPPEIELKAFSSYRVNNDFQKVLTDPVRLSYGEFWVRIGEEFELTFNLRDDSEIEKYEVYRLDGSGNRVETKLFKKFDPTECPKDSRTELSTKFNDVMDWNEPTQYEISVTDNYDNQSTRRILLVHPVFNMSPQIHFVTPANDHEIVAGKYYIVVSVAITDDRMLRGNNIEIFADDIQLHELSVKDNDISGGQWALQNAFQNMYDDIKSTYSTSMADKYGKIDSPHANQRSYIMAIPEGLVQKDEIVRLLARVKDSDGAIGTHEIQIKALPDKINPEIAVTQPEIGFGAIENSDFKLGFRAYDNVKVSQIKVYQTYGIRDPSGKYYQADYKTPIRTITDIPPHDFEPVTTLNIDTEEYTSLIHVKRLKDILSEFPDMIITENTLFDIWFRIEAIDSSGHVRTREISYPVHFDERPVVDILSPVNGERVVEGSQLIVNVHAFDDVAIDSLRLVAIRDKSDPFFNVRLKQPPYQFQILIPFFDSENPSTNNISLHVEAIDTYGATYDDLDKHRAIEDISVEIIPDQPPAIVIGEPQNNAAITEGEHLLVQVNAIDDIGLNGVELSVSGLINGDKTFTDRRFPYEFYVEIPYGQAGTDLYLSAKTQEVKFSVNGEQHEQRIAQTPFATVVHVLRDTMSPEIIVHLPTPDGTTAVEKRPLSFDAEITDNVRISHVQVEVLAESGPNLISETIARNIMINPPYKGVFFLKTIKEYRKDDNSNTPLPLWVRFTAKDPAGNMTQIERPVTLIPNTPPLIKSIQILDNRGFNMGDTLNTITEARSIIVNVIASDKESGVQKVRLFQSLGDQDNYSTVGSDEAAPFQFHLKIPVGHCNEQIHFKAEATDVDSYISAESMTRSLTILEDQPPEATITKPDNNDSVVIRGQDIEVFVKAIDDLGYEGIDRVVFYINDIPVTTTYNSYAETTGSFAMEHIYRAFIVPPEGARGIDIYAIAFDQLGNSGKTQTIRVGQVEDTVAPELSILSPVDGDILTPGETIYLIASVADIGVDSERKVKMQLIREYLDGEKGWKTISQTTKELRRIDNHDSVIPVSDPENHVYIYGCEFSDGSILKRSNRFQEHVKIITSVQTRNHEIKKETTHEIGLTISEKVYFASFEKNQDQIQNEGFPEPKDIYYTAIDQFKGQVRTGALIGAWSIHDPMRLEDELGNLIIPDFNHNISFKPRTGLFIADDTNDAPDDGQGGHYIYSELLTGASELFWGAITEIQADENIVLAAKTGIPESILYQNFMEVVEHSFSAPLIDAINQNEETGRVDEDPNGELLLFTTQNGEGQFGLPYLLIGRIEMPYIDVYGVCRKDDLAFVANGNGGVQVIDISNFKAPYHVGYIKPNGFARDVAIYDHYLVIAASLEGIVIADLLEPSMPIISTLDTMGVANRLFIEGNRVYVADMCGDSQISQLNEISLSDPFHPKLIQTIRLTPARKDLVPDGVYDVYVKSGKAYVTVHYSDQEDVPAQSLVEIIDLSGLTTSQYDSTIPVVIHKQATDDNFAARGMTIARNGLYVAASKNGFNKIDFPCLTVLSHYPLQNEEQISTKFDGIEIELSQSLAQNVSLVDAIRINAVDVQFGDDYSTDFHYSIDQTHIYLNRKTNAELLSDTKYFVSIDASQLSPSSGNPMPSDYTFSFITSPADDEPSPDIIRVEPSKGSIEGNTSIRVYGKNFGTNPTVIIGGQQLIIDKITLSDGINYTEDTIHAHTVPNYAGPASVQVIHENGLHDSVIGGFTYVDILHISFITPPVVRVSQKGVGDKVEIIGYGFNSSVSIKAWKSGQPETALTDNVDQTWLDQTSEEKNRLILYSSEKMYWTVPDFGDEYRGFVDIEIFDSQGRQYLMPNALFYGNLVINRASEVSSPLAIKDVRGYMDPNTTHAVDVGKLPPGEIVDLASDTSLNYIYVLGKGVLADNKLIDKATTHEYFYHYFAPGWISLLHYNRNDLQNTSPLHGLAYYNLPQDVVPQTLILSDSHVYISAKGYHFPYIDTQYEDQNVILGML